MVVGLLGAALEDVVIEVGNGAAGEARDELGAGLLVLVPMQSPRLMAHLSRPLGRTLFAPPGLKSTVSRSLCHLQIFINICTFSIALKFSMKMKRS